MTNKICNINLNNAELLTDEQLAGVSGSTVAELDELRSAILSKGFSANGVDLAGKAATKALPTGNIPFAYMMENKWLPSFRVKGHISIGFPGTGAGSVPNTYCDSRTGRIMTHEEVIERIKKHTLKIFF